MVRTLSLIALGLLAATASADRVPSSKAPGQKNFGTRGDITVPYLTNGNTTLGVTQGVSPIVFESNGIAPNGSQQRPVYNLTFYGSIRSYTADGAGAVQREPNRLRR